MKLEDMLYTFHTKDGLLIGVRHLRYDDAVYLVGIFENMNADSRYQRFHQTVDHLHAGRIWQEAETIAHMDAKKQDGLIAFADLPDNCNTPVGAARYVCLGDGRAETAVSIRDDMQSRGIGSELLGVLAEEARHNGIQQLVAEVLNSNKGMMGVLKKLPYEITRELEGTYGVLTIHLDKLKEGCMRAETAVDPSSFSPYVDPVAKIPGEEQLSSVNDAEFIRKSIWRVLISPTWRRSISPDGGDESFFARYYGQRRGKRKTGKIIQELQQDDGDSAEKQR